MFISPFGLGLYHSGVEVGGWEYSFASRGAGIFKIAPKQAKGVRFCKRIEIGSLENGEEGGEVQEALTVLRDNFQPEDYDLVTKNCNHFCDAFLQQLLGKRLPGFVNRMACIFSTGSIAWLVPKSLRKKAPVGDKDLHAYKGFVPFLKSIVGISSVVVSEWLDVGVSIADLVSSTKGLSILLEDEILDIMESKVESDTC
jgi:hypothetical protein